MVPLPPHDDRERAWSQCVRFSRMNLGRFLEDFQRSVQLFELLERGGGPPTVGVFGGIFIQFRIIAARDGAMNLFHFRTSLKGMTEQIPHCPLFIASATLVQVTAALATFDQYFPNTSVIRNTIAHAGELNNSPPENEIKHTNQTPQGRRHRNRPRKHAYSWALRSALYRGARWQVILVEDGQCFY